MQQKWDSYGQRKDAMGGKSRSQVGSLLWWLTGTTPLRSITMSLAEMPMP